MKQTSLALLLDVDGPIANPAARAIIEPTIVSSIITLLSNGIPVVFNTGRADAFVAEKVLPPITSHEGFKPSFVDRCFAICEKGAVVVRIDKSNDYQVEVDRAISVPKELWHAIEMLTKEFSDFMFFDEFERSMVSVEQNIGVDSDVFIEARDQFVERCWNLMTQMGMGVQLGDRRHADETGAVEFRIDPSIIAIDIERVEVGKDLGASKAHRLISEAGYSPVSWRTVGDSDGDYKMAEWLHARNFAVKHVDVRAISYPSLPAQFDVLRPSNSVFDDAGAAYLRVLASAIDAGETEILNEQNFDSRNDLPD